MHESEPHTKVDVEAVKAERSERERVDAAVRAGRKRAAVAFAERFGLPPLMDGQDQYDRMADEHVERQERIDDLHSPADGSVEALIVRRMGAVAEAGTNWLEDGDRYLDGLREAMVPLVMTVEAADAVLAGKLAPRAEAVRDADEAYRHAVWWELALQHTPDDAAEWLGGGEYSSSKEIDPLVWRVYRHAAEVGYGGGALTENFADYRQYKLSLARGDCKEWRDALTEAVKRLLVLLGIERLRLGEGNTLAGGEAARDDEERGEAGDAGVSSRPASTGNESAGGSVGTGKSREQVKIEAERIVKRDGYRGLNRLMKEVDCGKGNLLNAIAESLYLKARKAEHEAQKPRGKAVPMTDAVMDAAAAPEPSRSGQERLIAEMHAESLQQDRRDERQHRRAKKRRA